MTSNDTTAIFTVSTALAILAKLATSPTIDKAYITAGYGIAALYATNDFDGYFESNGPVEFERLLDEVRYTYTMSIQDPENNQSTDDGLVTIRISAKTLYDKILTDLQGNTHYLANTLYGKILTYQQNLPPHVDDLTSDEA